MDPSSTEDMRGTMQRYYVGVSATSRIVFRTATSPNYDAATGAYRYVIGPFRTKGAALLMARYGASNVHLRDTGDAERFNKQLPSRWYKMAGMVPNQHLNAMTPQDSAAD